MNAVSSATYASPNRPTKSRYGGPAGKTCPGSAERSAIASSSPAQTLPAEPISSSRTSYPALLYRPQDTTARVPSSRVSVALAVSTSPAARKNSSPRFAPVAYTCVTSRPDAQRIASKSCTAQSRKIPPDPEMYPAGGGAASNVVDLIVCSQPSDPDRAASRAARNPASKRRWNQIGRAHV